MTKCNLEVLEFPSFDRRKIQGSFRGGDVSSDGGLMLLRQVDRRLGLCQALDKVFDDPRDARRTTHRQIDLLRQRVYGIALGYEDLNDHDTLREDVAWQTALERDTPLGSSPTLCRLDARASRQVAWAFSMVLFNAFVRSFQKAPKELVLDFDATDDRVHGQQEGRFYHGYYRQWCFLPLYVFCGDQLVASYLRPSNIDAAKHSWAILKLLVNALREKWPKTRIVFRADSGFCRWKMLRWCEKNGVQYIVGLAKNTRLQALSAEVMQQASKDFDEQRVKQRRFEWIDYAADSWDKPRRIIVKAEHGPKGANPRFVVTNLDGQAQQLYDKVYCARGEMENRIKEQQLGLFADRTSCGHWWSNQLRLLFSSAAYVLIDTLRRLGLEGTELARAQVTTIRLKLFKVGTVILRNTRRIQLLFSSAYPYQDLFRHALRTFSSA